ncbi:MAG TPA: RNA polymerase sigma factor, partial [Gemmataceae bacterium]|nr:RNA polymerase sigma factor [Gemmataceae bacterium]
MGTNAVNRVIRHLRRAAFHQNGTGLTDSELLEHYLTRRDEAAFEGLVHRHGPMVLGVCRRILRNEADAEDAFQATFLVFVRKAASIRSRSTLSNWLYGVAHNTALKAKAMNCKRHLKEKEAGTAPKQEARAEVWQEVQALLDAELSRLPDKYRIPIVLCDLEGKTIKEAARHLGWPQGTVATRLARGRAQLAKRLTKRGLTLSGGV